jgi:hypothetical protein
MRAWIFIASLCGCSVPANVQCDGDGDCGRLPGGHCSTSSTGNHWCSYTDGACASGERWSDRDVGDGLAGTCVGSEVMPPDGAIDGIDAPLACVAGATTCASDTYVECSPQGEVLRAIHCPLGCDSGAARCVDVAPSNGLAAQLDLTPEAPAIVFTGASTINTTTGVVFNGGTTIAVPNELVGGMRVFRFKTLEVQQTLKVSGTASLAIVVDGDVTIAGLIDVSADGTTSGPGRIVGGACAGGKSQNSGGGGGGGRFDDGASGGSGNGNPGGLGGTSQRDLDLVPLVGGCAGGGWGTITVPGVPGGGGGGAIQIVSRTSISIRGTGRIDASGGGGGSGGTAMTIGSTPGTGGGAGGAVLLEAPQIVLDGAGVAISTKGGGGGGATPEGAARPGSDGGTDAAPAAGGAYLMGFASGGLGGTAQATPDRGGNDADAPGAGGGGAVGEARFNTTAGVINPQNGASIYSRRTSGVLATRLIP